MKDWGGEPFEEKMRRLVAERHAQATISRSLEQNNRHFQEAREKLEKWADDMIMAAERELKDTKERIKALTRQARLATTIEEQHALQKQIQELENKNAGSASASSTSRTRSWPNEMS
jgi:organic radical activating enzyme